MTKPVWINGANFGLNGTCGREILWPVHFEIDPFSIAHIRTHVAGRMWNMPNPSGRTDQFYAHLTAHSHAKDEWVPQFKPLSMLTANAAHFINRYANPVAGLLDTDRTHVPLSNVPFPLARAKGGELTYATIQRSKSRHKYSLPILAAEQFTPTEIRCFDDCEFSANLSKLWLNKTLYEGPCPRFFPASISHEADVWLGKFTLCDQDGNSARLRSTTTTPNLSTCHHDSVLQY